MQSIIFMKFEYYKIKKKPEFQNLINKTVILNKNQEHIWPKKSYLCYLSMLRF